MSMADKKRKLMAQRQASEPAAPHVAGHAKPSLERASVMVLATQEEADVTTRPLPEWPDGTLASGTVHSGEPSDFDTSGTTPAGDTAIPEVSKSTPIRQQVARIQPSVPAEKVGATLDLLLRGLQAKGADTRTLRLTLPYSLRLDAELYRILHAQAESAAAAALQAFREAPQDNLDAITGAASLVAERRRRPSKGGLGQAGTVSMTLDGPQSETLEVLARRAGLSCGAFLEGAALIWAIRHGYLELDTR